LAADPGLIHPNPGAGKRKRTSGKEIPHSFSLKT